jgi:hypothetical protein
MTKLQCIPEGDVRQLFSFICLIMLSPKTFGLPRNDGIKLSGSLG